MCEDFDEFIIRIKFKSELRNIYIKKEELTVQSLLSSAFGAFQIKVQNEVKVNLADSFGIPIPECKVLYHVKAFWRSDSFYLNLSYKGDQSSRNMNVMTPKMIEDYMKSINQRDLLDQCKGEQIKDVGSRHKIVQIAVDFMIEQFGENLTMFQRQMVSQALIKLFPFLGFKDGENIGIRTLVNGSNGGWLNTRFYHVRQTKRKQEEGEKPIPQSNPIQESENPQADVDYLKSLIVCAENLETFKEKLNATRNYRDLMMKKDETELKEHFPYFFTHPGIMIPMEFEAKYNTAHVDSNGMIDNWKYYHRQLIDVLTVQNKKKTYETNWCADIQTVLLLLQLFPSKQVGRNVIATSRNFDLSVESLLKFEMLHTPPTELAQASKSYPTIVACGETSSEIQYFCLKVENQIIPLPDDMDFLHVFDLFFKVHKIFDLKYEPRLHNMMVFVENFIYKVKNEHRPTNRMLEISGYLEISGHLEKDDDMDLLAPSAA